MQNTRKVFDFINYYQKCIEISSKIKIFLLGNEKCPSFNEFGDHFLRSLMSKSQNFLTLRPNHGGSSQVATVIEYFDNLPPHFSKLDYEPVYRCAIVVSTWKNTFAIFVSQKFFSPPPHFRIHSAGPAPYLEICFVIYFDSSALLTCIYFLKRMKSRTID